MSPNRMIVEVAVVGCLAAAMMSGASAQERDNIGGHVTARADGSHMRATSQLNRAPRQGGSHYTTVGGMGEASVRDNRAFTAGQSSKENGVSHVLDPRPGTAGAVIAESLAALPSRTAVPGAVTAWPTATVALAWA